MSIEHFFIIKVKPATIAQEVAVAVEVGTESIVLIFHDNFAVVDYTEFVVVDWIVVADFVVDESVAVVVSLVELSTA